MTKTTTTKTTRANVTNMAAATVATTTVPAAKRLAVRLAKQNQASMTAGTMAFGVATVIVERLRLAVTAVVSPIGGTPYTAIARV